MRSTARASVHSDALMVDVPAIIPHIIEEHLGVESLYYMSAVGLMAVLSVFIFALSPAIEVEVDTHGTHPGECTEALLLVRTVASATKMTVRADDKGKLIRAVLCLSVF